MNTIILMGLMIVAVSLGVLVYCHRKKRRCTEAYEASIVEETKQGSQTLEYEVEGAVYRKKYHLKSYYLGQVGESIIIYVNPQNAKDVYLVKWDILLRIISILLMVFGLFVLLFAFFVAGGA